MWKQIVVIAFTSAQCEQCQTMNSPSCCFFFCFCWWHKEFVYNCFILLRRFIVSVLYDSISCYHFSLLSLQPQRLFNWVPKLFSWNERNFVFDWNSYPNHFLCKRLKCHTAHFNRLPPFSLCLCIQTIQKTLASTQIFLRTLNSTKQYNE